MTNFILFFFKKIKKMKNIVKLLCLLLFISFISCQNNATNEDNTAADETAQQQEEGKCFPDSLAYVMRNHKRVFPECEGDECTSYIVNYIELSDNKYSFINDKIKAELVGDHASIDDAADNFFDNYEKGVMETQTQFAWEQETNVGVDFNQNGLLTVNIGSFAYLGGAHGMSSFNSINYDLETNKELAFYDLVNANDSIALKTLGEKKFRSNNKLEPNESLMNSGYFWDDGKFYFSETFSLTGDGVMFTFAPYEIGPYAIGMPEFTIPYAELKPFLTENSPLKRLMK